jgi:hypothetical protein
VTGDRLAGLARQLVHPDTFCLVVSPAIADLQFETDRQSLRSCLRAYVAVWTALGLACWEDLMWDARRPAWVEAASALTLLAGVAAAYHVAMAVIVLGFDRRFGLSLTEPFLRDVSATSILLAVGAVFTGGAACVALGAHVVTPPGESVDR